jgi:hypothetical protein
MLFNPSATAYEVVGARREVAAPRKFARHARSGEVAVSQIDETQE